MLFQVCICDDLPHVINAVDNQQRASPGHELIQSGLTLQVGYGRNLTIKATSQDDNDLCLVNPQTEVKFFFKMTNQESFSKIQFCMQKILLRKLRSFKT